MKLDILEKSLLKSLVDGTISFADVMNAYNVKSTLCKELPPNVLGFVYVSRRGNYHLVLNANTSHETQCRTFIHEIKHIICDLPKVGYIIGLDLQHTRLEQETDLIAECLAGYAAFK